MDFIDLTNEIKKNVSNALVEDIGSGDYTALLTPGKKKINASVICRENALLCGAQWFDSCFQQLASDISIQWHFKDGDTITSDHKICEIEGNARAVLTAERTALNFLQTLSAVATKTRRYVDMVSSTDVKIVDTRKTLPGLRIAQKYAVKCGGGVNHRLGLYDGILIKENHIIATGGIEQALNKAKALAPSDLFIQIEIETLNELRIALNAGAKMVLLDNFSLDQLRAAVILTKQLANQHTLLEASGNITLENVKAVAETGVDRISIGSLTKDVKAIDLSMRFQSI